MIFYTSDLHWGHKNIIASCKRPFISVEEMNAALIANWNRKVEQEDTVYVLGDLFFYPKSPAAQVLTALKGHKHLIIGNHDFNWMKKVDLSMYFESVQYMTQIRDADKRITLCHYPMMTWHDAGRGTYLIYGHIHNNTRDPFWPMLRTMENAFNAGVDINHFEPVTFEELRENNRRFILQGGIQ